MFLIYYLVLQTYPISVPKYTNYQQHAPADETNKIIYKLSVN